MNLNNEKGFSLNKSSNNKKDGESNFFDKILNYFSQEKVIMKTIFVVGVFSIILGVFGMYFRIRNSFADSQVVLEDKAAVIENLNRTKDTDNDGLSDYDELNVYGTSPYLEDTDLDKVSDYDEMILGLDGKCEGNACSNIVTPTESNINFSSSATEELQNMTFEEFKNYLLESGYEKDYVASLTEVEFNEIKKNMINSDSNSKDANTIEDAKNTSTNEELKQLEQMKNFSIDQIKEFMIQGGATAEDLSKVSNEELRQIFLQTLDEISSSEQ